MKRVIKPEGLGKIESLISFPLIFLVVFLVIRCICHHTTSLVFRVTFEF